MTDRECIICRSISGTKTWSAECSLYNCSCFHQICDCSIFHKFHINRCTCRIYTECKLIRTDVSSFYNIRCCTDIFKSTTCTSRDDSLINIEFSVHNLALKRIIHCSVQTDQSLFLHFMEDIRQICIHFINRIYIAWVERHRDHWLDLAHIDINHSIIVSHCSRIQLLISLASSMDLIEFLDLFICFPDRRQTGCLCCHNIDSNSVVCT